MRPQRWFSVAAAGGAVALSLGACGTGGTGSPHERPNRWTLSVTDPGTGSYEPCLKDPMIEESFASADYPASFLGMSLAAAATETDAERIAACLRLALPDSEVEVTGPETG